MIRFPKEFVLNNIPIKVVIEEEIIDSLTGEVLFGEFNPITAEIHIGTHCNGVAICPEVMKNTFYHELAHALLWAIGSPDWTNELLVQNLGTSIQNYYKTCLYDSECN